jgi:hypothetical protein
MFFTAHLVRQLREIASIVGLTGIASEIVGESSDGVCALGVLDATRTVSPAALFTQRPHIRTRTLPSPSPQRRPCSKHRLLLARGRRNNRLTRSPQFRDERNKRRFPEARAARRQRRPGRPRSRRRLIGLARSRCASSGTTAPLAVLAFRLRGLTPWPIETTRHLSPGPSRRPLGRQPCLPISPTFRRTRVPSCGRSLILPRRPTKLQVRLLRPFLGGLTAGGCRSTLK